MAYNINSKWVKPSLINASNDKGDQGTLVYWKREKTGQRYAAIWIPREKKFACLTCFGTFPTLDDLAGHAEIHIRTRRGYVDNSENYLGKGKNLEVKIKVEDEDYYENGNNDNERRVEPQVGNDESSDDISDQESEDKDNQLENPVAERDIFNKGLGKSLDRIQDVLVKIQSDTQDSYNQKEGSISESMSSSSEQLSSEAGNDTDRGSTTTSNGEETPTTTHLSSRLAKLISLKGTEQNPLLQVPINKKTPRIQKLTLPNRYTFPPLIRSEKSSVTSSGTPDRIGESETGVENNGISSPLFMTSDGESGTESDDPDAYVSADDSLGEEHLAQDKKKTKTKTKRARIKGKHRTTKSEKRKIQLLEQHPELVDQYITYSKVKKPKITQMSLENALIQLEGSSIKSLPSWQKQYLSNKPKVKVEKLIDLKEVIENKSTNFKERVKEDRRRLPKRAQPPLSNNIPTQFLQFLQPPNP